MTLIGLVLRAAAVVLVLSTVLVPAADHHAPSRLPQGLALPADLARAGDNPRHHHSSAALARSLQNMPLIELVGSPGPPFGRGLAVQPVVTLPPAVTLFEARPGWRLAETTRIPSSLLEPPLVRPPILVA